MLASDLVTILQENIKNYGDQEVIYNCDHVDCLDCNEVCECMYFEIGKVAFFTDLEGNRKYMLTCGEE